MISAKLQHITIFKRRFLSLCRMFKHLYFYAWACRSWISQASRYNISTLKIISMIWTRCLMFHHTYRDKLVDTSGCSKLDHNVHLQRQMQLERGQIHSLLLKVGKKLYKYLNGIATKEIASTLPRLKEVSSDGKTNKTLPCSFAQ